VADRGTLGSFLIEDGDLVLPDRVVRSGAVLVAEGRIAFAGARDSLKQPVPRRCARVSADGGIICPALWELHIHGAGGASTENATPGSIRDMGRFLARQGVGAFLPTTIGSETCIAALGKALEETASDPGLAGRIPGIYVEGPFIAPSRRGGIPEDAVHPVSLERLDKLLALGRNRVRIMTYAPELEGADGLAQAMRARGVQPSMGHSEARMDRLPRGSGQETVSVTHLFNAMSGVSHKEPGLAQWALLDGGAFTEMTCDGVHVHDAAIAMALRLRSWERMLVISDAMPPAGLEDGDPAGRDQSLYGRPVKARGDGVYYEGSGVLVGSRLLARDGIARLVSRHQVPLARAVGMATLNPARLLGYASKGALLEGFDGDVAVMSRDLVRCSFMAWEGRVLHERGEGAA
jgi:N-acetylglucosamine-6-phosphate deacetylase